LAQLGLSRLDYLIVTAVNGNIPAWDGSTSSPKIKLFWVDTTTDGAPMAEVASTTDVSSTTARFLAIGA
jgi:phosphopentomutase